MSRRSRRELKNLEALLRRGLPIEGWQRRNLKLLRPSVSPTIDDALRERIKGLPQELQDLVFESYLTSFSESQEISCNYKVPPQLQIDRASRYKAAQAYYGGTIFCIDVTFGQTRLQWWLESLSDGHRLMIGHIQNVLEEEWTNKRRPDDTHYASSWMRRDVEFGKHPSMNCLTFKPDIWWAYMWMKKDGTEIVDWTRRF